MSHYEMHAYHDRKADPVLKQCVQTSSCVPEYMPKLAVQAGLGKYLTHNGDGRHIYENGEILAKRVTEQECS